MGEMTRKWLVAIIAAIVVVLLVVWAYTTWAADEVESDVADDPVSVLVTVPPPAAA